MYRCTTVPVTRQQKTIGENETPLLVQTVCAIPQELPFDFALHTYIYIDGQNNTF